MRSHCAFVILGIVALTPLAGCRAEQRASLAGENVALGQLSPAGQRPIFLGAGDRLGRDVYSAYLAQHHVEEMYAAE